MMRVFLAIVILLGYLWIGVVGTGTKVVFQWPGLMLLGFGFVMLPLFRFKAHSVRISYSDLSKFRTPEPQTAFDRGLKKQMSAGSFHYLFLLLVITDLS